jgi:hypothetical protein
MVSALNLCKRTAGLSRIFLQLVEMYFQFTNRQLLLTNCRERLTGEKLKRIYKDESRKVNGRREYDILKAIKKLAEKEVETGLEQLDHPG